MTFARRRWRNLTISIVFMAVILFVHRAYDISLHQEKFLTGWLLLGGVLLLALYNSRKKVSMVPLGSNAAWLQFHIYLGLITVAVFGMHIGWHIPNGWLEGILAVLFLLVAGSGVAGLYLSRRFSRLLTRRGEEVIFERIPTFIVKLREEAEEVVLASAAETGSSTLADHYTRHLADFFGGPRNYFSHIISSSRTLFSQINEIANMERYLNDKERVYSEKLRELVEKKDELDYHHALQLTLKSWLFVHVPLTYGMVLLALVHLVLAYAFSGGV